jgi:hypothetical protein
MALTPTLDCAARLLCLLESGIITQQQLRTSPVVAKMIRLALLFPEFHKSEIRFPILNRSAGLWGLV